MQSAYRPFHCSETTVMKVFSDDLLFAADVVQMSALCVLDLTAGFDTVHHDLLLVRLERQFALRGIVLVCDGVARIWCEGHNSGSSYATNRTSGVRNAHSRDAASSAAVQLQRMSNRRLQV